MFNCLRCCTLITILLAGTASITAQSVSVDHIDGYNDYAMIANGSSRNIIYIRLTNNDENHGGVTNGFSISSPYSISWTSSHGDTISFGWPDLFNLGFTIRNWNTDGIGADTIGYSGARLSSTGLPANFDEVAYFITIGPISPSAHNTTIVVDSTFYPDVGTWKWAATNVYPAWGGPYIYRVVDPSRCTGTDTDADQYPAGCDNCPSNYNPYQEDRDDDNRGDLCDNCPDDPNEDQLDTDNDGVGDVCDPCTDSDGDGYGDPGFANPGCPEDNCPDVYNPTQADTDNDGYADACDNCPTTYNINQEDIDEDLFGDVCDNCPNDPDNDIDNDGYCADVDNCPEVYNPGQEDDDNNNVGNVCEGCCRGVRGDGIWYKYDRFDISDLVALADLFFSEYGSPPLECEDEADYDANGRIDISDLLAILDYFFAGGYPPKPCY